MIQPVDGTRPELDLLSFATWYREGPVDSQVVVEVSTGAHIGIALSALLSNVGSGKAVPIHSLVMHETGGWIASQHRHDRKRSICSEICLRTKRAGDPHRLLGCGVVRCWKARRHI